MSSYGRSEHECLPNIEQRMLIGDNSEHIFLHRAEQYMSIDNSSANMFVLRPKQDLLTSGGLKHPCYSGSEKNFVKS